MYYHVNAMPSSDASPAPADRRPESLVGLRQRLGKSQSEIAVATGTTQSGVSRLERQHDMLVSTLRDYVSALGCRLRISVEDSNGRSVDLAVGPPDADAGTEPREFRVVWQDTRSRAFVHVGWLRFDGRRHTFSYTDEARQSPGFEPFPSFPDLDKTYESTELFAFFADRTATASASAEAHAEVLEALGFAKQGATPVELLARSPGSPHDLIQVVPEPVEASDGSLSRIFLVSGARHVDDQLATSALIEDLHPGESLSLRPEPDNEYNPNALQVVARGRPVGWIPDYLADEVGAVVESGRRWNLSVLRANGPDVPWHLRLLCTLVVDAD